MMLVCSSASQCLFFSAFWLCSCTRSSAGLAMRPCGLAGLIFGILPDPPPNTHRPLHHSHFGLLCQRYCCSKGVASGAQVCRECLSSNVQLMASGHCITAHQALDCLLRDLNPPVWASLCKILSWMLAQLPELNCVRSLRGYNPCPILSCCCGTTFSGVVQGFMPAGIFAVPAVHVQGEAWPTCVAVGAPGAP